MTEKTIAENFKDIKMQIAQTARDHHRAADAVSLVAVSKKQPIEKIEQALETGHRCFGENRVQEAFDHWDYKRPSYPDLSLHLLGPLQTNKVQEAVALFDVIQTLDRPKLAGALAEEMQKQKRYLPCFIQVNTGLEAQKSGIPPDDLAAFLEFCTQRCKLKIIGLMCIPPLKDPPAVHFSVLQRLAYIHDLKCLSMGMSDDFEKGIAWGATHVRIGSALFGARDEDSIVN